MWPFRQHPVPATDQPPKATITTKAWAIDSCSKEGHVFLGVFWFFPLGTLHYYQDGMRIALFRTRTAARRAMEGDRVKETYPKARVARVTIVISG